MRIQKACFLHFEGVKLSKKRENQFFWTGKKPEDENNETKLS